MPDLCSCNNSVVCSQRACGNAASGLQVALPPKPNNVFPVVRMSLSPLPDSLNTARSSCVKTGLGSLSYDVTPRLESVVSVVLKSGACS